MKTVAFVPLRLNSQRVAGKNLRLLGGEPLMCHILRTLAGIGEIDEVYAYCSDERICEYWTQCSPAFWPLRWPRAFRSMAQPCFAMEICRKMPQ